MRIISILVIVLLMVSCKQDKRIGINQTTGIDTAAIELRTHRKLISIDTMMLHPQEREHLAFYLKTERNIVKENVMVAFDHEIGDDFEVLHFLSDKHNCHYNCPDIHIQLYDSEYERLYEHLHTFPKGESKSEIKDTKNNIAQRTIVSLKDGFSATIDAECESSSCKGYEMTLQLDYKTKEMTCHIHHRDVCQTHPEDFYNRIWKRQRAKGKI